MNRVAIPPGTRSCSHFLLVFGLLRFHFVSFLRLPCLDGPLKVVNPEASLGESGQDRLQKLCLIPSHAISKFQPQVLLRNLDRRTVLQESLDGATEVLRSGETWKRFLIRVGDKT